MTNISVLEQRRATKRIALKRYHKLGLKHTLNKIEDLKEKFPKNLEYYKALEKGLIKLDSEKSN